MNFADRLIDAIEKKGNPCLVGLDFHQKGLPEFIVNALRKASSAEACHSVIGDFLKLIIDSVGPYVPAVKPQVSLLEPFSWVGSLVLRDIIRHAQEQGLIVIADAKRSDIASSAEGYASAFLGTRQEDGFSGGYGADAVTVNPFLGLDSLTPFAESCRVNDRGMFVLVKTSNPGSTATQDNLLESHEPIYTQYARTVKELGQPLIGQHGYSSVGAVVGATFPEQAKCIRTIIPNAIILVPGYGAQGASASDVAVNFSFLDDFSGINSKGYGACLPRSRA